MQRAPNEPVVSPRWTNQVPSNNESMAQQVGSLHSSSLHSSGPGQSRAEWPRADAPASSPNKSMTPSVTVLPLYLMPGGRTSKDQLPATDPVSGGPGTTLAAALNDKLDQIAQQFDWLEHHHDTSEHQSDDVAQQLQLLLQNFQTLSQNSQATLSEVTSDVVGMKWARLDSRSTATSMES